MGISATGGSGTVTAGDYIKTASTPAAAQITLKVPRPPRRAPATTIAFANANGLTKTGPGTVILGTTANTFSGQVAVLNGTLSIDHRLLAAAVPSAPRNLWARALGPPSSAVGAGKTGVLSYTGNGEPSCGPRPTTACLSISGTVASVSSISTTPPRKRSFSAAPSLAVAV